jgi:glutathione S-transferase
MDVFISAKASGINSPLQAEASALVTAAEVVSSLLLQGPIFFTDNLSLAKAAAAPGARDHAMLWEIRRQSIQFQELTQSLKAKIVHVGRHLNKIAHSCAQQAMRSSRTLPICSCRNTAHSNLACPVAVAVQRLHLQGTVILSVQCL